MRIRVSSVASFALCTLLLAGCWDNNSGEGGATYNCTQHCGSSTGATNPFTASSQSAAEEQCAAQIPDCAQTRSCSCVRQ